MAGQQSIKIGTGGTRLIIFANSTTDPLPSSADYAVFVGAGSGGQNPTGNGHVAIGYRSQRGASVTGVDTISIGAAANYNGSGAFNQVLFIGSSYDSSAGMVNTASNQAVIGMPKNNGYTQFYLGQSVTAASPAGVTINATGGSGTNNYGGNLVLAAGKGTGNANTSGSILFQTAPSSSSGTSSQTLVTRLTITQYGTLRAGNIHDNLDPTGSSAEQDIRSGTYTPILANGTNLDSSSSLAAQWLRVGNVVNVSGRLNLDPTLTATSTSVTIQLPIASNFISKSDCGGVAFCGDISGLGASIAADSTNDAALLEFIAGDVTSQPFAYNFTYLVR